MTAALAEPAIQHGEQTERVRVAAELMIDGPVRFLAHHDELRMLMRALVRAGWPLAWSHGFNPKPKLWLPLPRNVGTATDSQWLLADLTDAVTAPTLHQQLAEELPRGCAVQRVVTGLDRAMPHPQLVEYQVKLDDEDAAGMESRIAALLSRDALPVQREYGPDKPTRALDLRPLIETTEFAAGVLRMRLRFVEQRTVRPAELLMELGLAAEKYTHLLRRVEVQWDLQIAEAPTKGGDRRKGLS